MCRNRKDVIFMQRRLYIDKAHRALDKFRQRFRDSALPYTAVTVIFLIGTSVRRSSGRRSGGVLQVVDCWQTTQWPLFSLVFSFFPRFFSPVFLRRNLFSKKECSNKKAKVDYNAQKPRGTLLSRPPRPLTRGWSSIKREVDGSVKKPRGTDPFQTPSTILGTLMAILDF